MATFRSSARWAFAMGVLSCACGVPSVIFVDDDAASEGGATEAGAGDALTDAGPGEDVAVDALGRDGPSEAGDAGGDADAAADVGPAGDASGCPAMAPPGATMCCDASPCYGAACAAVCSQCSATCDKPGQICCAHPRNVTCKMQGMSCP